MSEECSEFAIKISFLYPLKILFPSIKEMIKEEYLKRILKADVYDVARETPLHKAPALSERLNNTVLLKREDLQSVFSFKLRGAYNKMAKLTPEQRAKGVIAASAGNHAQGVALAANRLGCRAVIVMPTTAPELKVKTVRRLGGEVVLVGDSFSDAAAHAEILQAKEGLIPVHPFNDPEVIAGQGTIAVEIIRQAQQQKSKIDAIFIPIGGGGLAGGVAVYIKALYPEIKIFGVQTSDADSMRQSIEKNKIVALKDVGLFSDGTAVKVVGTETFKLCSQFCDGVITVTTDELCAAIKDVFQDTRSIMEPAGALSVAGIKKYVTENKVKDATFVGILSGANMNFDRLRFVAERTEVGEHREVLLAVTIPEEKGTFRRLVNMLGDRDITELNYRLSDPDFAQIYVGVKTQVPGDAEELKQCFLKNELACFDLTDNELAKSHLRYMVGGHSPQAMNERVFIFEFPERPGALSDFLAKSNLAWSLSMFHYRNQGQDYSKVLVGMQVPDSDQEKLEAFLTNLGYAYVEETHNPAYQLFLA